MLVWSRGEWVEGVERGASLLTGIAGTIWVVILVVTGVMILAVSSRVALAHTGRALHAARLTVIAYVILNLAAVLRGVRGKSVKGRT